MIPWMQCKFKGIHVMNKSNPCKMIAWNIRLLKITNLSYCCLYVDTGCYVAFCGGMIKKRSFWLHFSFAESTL